jgi:hypothetical protein
MAKKPTPKKKEKTLEELKKEFEISFARFGKLSENIKKKVKGTINPIRLN